MSEEIKFKTVEIVAGYSGKKGDGDYGNDGILFSDKEIMENCDWTDEQKRDRKIKLMLENYDLYQEFKYAAEQEGRKTPDPEPLSKEFAEIKQTALTLIAEQGKWFNKHKHASAFKVIYHQVTGLEFKLELDDLSWFNARRLNKRLDVWKYKLELNGTNGKTKQKEKANESVSKN